MSEEPKGSLRFDRAEFDAAAPADFRCSACGQSVWTTYYAVNGQTFCERCKADLDLSAGRGSGPARFLKAAFLGLGAGAVGAGVWYAVRATTGYELGLIAIGVGLFVGAAVRKGSGGRGGWRYQALAIFLTYASIVSTYVPDVVSFLQKAAESEDAPAAEASAAAAPAEATTAADASSGPAEAAPAAQDAPPEGVGMLTAVAVYALVVLAIAFAAPFLGGFENVMGIVIIGIALYEAWKINRRTPLEITGPHRVGASTAPAVAPGSREDG